MALQVDGHTEGRRRTGEGDRRYYITGRVKDKRSIVESRKKMLEDEWLSDWSKMKRERAETLDFVMPLLFKATELNVFSRLQICVRLYGCNKFCV